MAKIGRPKKTRTSSTSLAEREPAAPDGETIVREPEPKKKSIASLKEEHIQKKKIQKAQQQKKLDTGLELVEEKTDSRIEEISRGFVLLGEAILEIVCARLPNPKPPTAVEKDLFARSLSELATKYSPSLVDYAPELMFTVTAAAVVLPRLKTETEKSFAERMVEKAQSEGRTLVVDLTKKETHGSDEQGKKSSTGDGQDGKRQDAPSEAPSVPVA